MADELVDTRSVQFKRAMALAGKFELTRDDRIDLAEMLLKRDIDSWARLTESELVRLIDALQGTEYVLHLVASGRRDSGNSRSA